MLFLQGVISQFVKIVRGDGHFTVRSKLNKFEHVRVKALYGEVFQYVMYG